MCLFAVVVLSLMHGMGLPLAPESRDDRKVRELLAEGPKEVRLTGYVLTRKVQEDYAYVVLGRTVLFLQSNYYHIDNVRITLETPFAYEAGSLLGVSGFLEKPEKATNPGQFDRDLYFRIQKIGYVMKKPAVTLLEGQREPLRELPLRLRELLFARIEALYPGEAAGTLAAMLIGDKSLLSDEDSSYYRMGGISHMLAISGLHITVLAMGLYRLLIALKLPYQASAGIALVFISFYAVMTGLSVSTVRAVVMFAVSMGAKLFGRTYDLLTALSLAAILLLLDNPCYLLYSGFQLSFLAVLCIYYSRERSRFAGGLILSLVSMPVVLSSFYEIPLLGVAVNLLLLPLLPAVLVFGILGTAFGGVFTLPAVFLLKAIRQLLLLLSRVPYASLILGNPSRLRILLYSACLAVFLYFYQRFRTDKRRFLLLLFVPLLVFVLGFHFRRGIRMTFLDVGQGDSCVMELADGSNFLVDGGSSTAYRVGEERILPFLKYEGIRRLDGVFVTHLDSDHTSGILELLEAVKKRTTSLRVGTVILPDIKRKDEAYLAMAELAREAGARVLSVKEGDVFSFGKTKLEVLGPDPERETEPFDSNAQCIVLRVSYGSFDALLTGDVQKEGEENLLEQLRERNISCEVLKVSHHGSAHSTPEEFLRELDAKIGVISAGKGNRYGHPDPELLKRLDEAGMEIFRTDLDGALLVESDGKEIRAKSWR